MVGIAGRVLTGKRKEAAREGSWGRLAAGVLGGALGGGLVGSGLGGFGGAAGATLMARSQDREKASRRGFREGTLPGALVGAGLGAAGLGYLAYPRRRPGLLRRIFSDPMKPTIRALDQTNNAGVIIGSLIPTSSLVGGISGAASEKYRNAKKDERLGRIKDSLSTFFRKT